ncbi:MAG: hypothetical protein HYR90_05045 [Candidatus Andersenbacteria bacterium]|nr:hypothetical protein [Candidatus Andersenbacteria bacterium]MBI3250744.1 hypothetical protein [Candidatus Andersenbacteria bacterium]
MSFFRPAFYAVGFLIVFGILVAVPKAHADPHAMFYTAIGQQQLFFNVLAALDQADYVEPSTNTTGTDSGSSREELIKERDEAAKALTEGETGYPAEDFPVLKATESDLASVLTRNISLEGQDIWTSYLLREAVKEEERREHFEKLTGILCNISQGACSGEKTPREAFETSPFEKAVNSITNGAVGALFSSNDPNSYDQERRRKALEDQFKGDAAESIPYRADIAALESATSGDVTKKTTITQLKNAQLRGLRNPVINPNALSGIVFDPETQEPSLAFDESSEEYDVSAFTGSISNFLTLNQALGSAASEGANKSIASKNSTTEDGGYLAETIQAARPAGNGAIGELSPRILRPAGAGPAVLSGVISSLGISEGIPSDVKLSDKEDSKDEDCDIKKDGICVKNNSPICFVGGSSLTVSFTLSSTGGESKAGVVALYPTQHDGEIGGPIRDPSYSPPSNNFYGSSGRSWGNQSIGNQTYSVSGTAQVNGVLGYRILFRYGQSSSVAATLIIPECNATTRSTDQSRIFGAQDSVTVSPSSPTPETINSPVNGSVLGTREDLRSADNDYLPLHEESYEAQSLLQALSPLHYQRKKPGNSSSGGTVSGASTTSYFQQAITNYFK